MSDCMPKILWATWPKLKHAPLGKVICAAARLSQVEARYQIWRL